MMELLASIRYQEENMVLSIDNLSCRFPIRRGIFKKTVGFIHALNNVSLKIHSGETVGLVGESGCGKSTLAKSIFNLIPYSVGSIKLNGKIIRDNRFTNSRLICKHAQLVFQDPTESLNPRMMIDKLLSEPFEIHNLGTQRLRKKWISSLIESVGLKDDILKRFPHQFSGGQRQRIGIARALALSPDYLICDEPVSALDVSVQAQILNLLLQIQKQRNLGLLIISHDLSVVRHISHKIGVMYMGELIESGTCDEVFDNPQHPYTQALLEAIPNPLDKTSNKKRKFLSGELPSPVILPKGCFFATRCPEAMPRCSIEKPQKKSRTETHKIICHLV